MDGVIDTDGVHAEWSFPAELGAVRAARHSVGDALREWRLDGEVRDTAMLLVSELVTNSLRYASGPIGVRLTRLPGGGDPAHDGDGTSSARGPALLVEVTDPLPDPPLARPAGPDDETGRGLQLVACSARRWGTRKGRTGKSVWFELPLPG
ncbi:ATP-binding protein [Streptomyces sp. NPDC046887]|uniref:ATP-binding protein n=1 Tax=Streptomyces sp. NPDC046887 TaxID=3155472 RepID=UPI0033D92B5F